jgi:2-polyprenyl-3-methyl-5-hydroxy-6-metoxy-1,4-benzoquinol methylase
MDVRKIYDESSEPYVRHIRAELGPVASYILEHDPKHLLFTLSRYKFVSKMLQGKQMVCEIGCGDGWGLPIVAQSVGHIHAYDWDMGLVNSVADTLKSPGWVKNITVYLLDVSDDGIANQLPINYYDGLYMIDVLEHFDPDKEEYILTKLVNSMTPDGTLIVGTPNKSATLYASKASDEQHINLKTYNELRETMSKYFRNVYMFGMNDEVLSTGYGPMCHYIFALCDWRIR